MHYDNYTFTITYMQEEDKVLLQIFGKNLKSLREKKYKSLNDFAFDTTLLSSATISRIENGLVDFKFSSLIKLANILEITPADLIKDINYKYSEY